VRCYIELSNPANVPEPINWTVRRRRLDCELFQKANISGSEASKNEGNDGLGEFRVDGDYNIGEIFKDGMETK
jgi:hypothetical protein